MILEKIKTFILLLLVLSGLILTAILWYGSRPYYEDTEAVFQEAFFFEEPRDEWGIISPYEIIVPADDGDFALFHRGSEFFETIWDTTKDFFATGELSEVTLSDLPEGAFSLKLTFAPPFLTEVLVGYGGGGTEKIKDAAIYINETAVYAHLSNEGEGLLIKINGPENGAAIANIVKSVLNKGYTNYYLLEERESREWEGNGEEPPLTGSDVAADAEEELLSEIAGDVFKVAGDIYLPREDYYLYPVLAFEKEKIELNDLLKAIFVDKDLARRIEEPDGTLIFTDGEKGLRIGENVEYTAPGLEKGVVTYSYRSALQKANEFICFYGGWPQGLFLKDIFPSNGELRGYDSYNGLWHFYKEGFPLLGERGGTELRFNDQGLFYYKRSLFIPVAFTGEKVRVAPGIDAVNEALNIYRDEVYTGEDEDAVFTLHSVYAGYLTGALTDRENLVAHPVWVVQVEDRVFYLDGVGLQRVSPGESDEYFKS